MGALNSSHDCIDLFGRRIGGGNRPFLIAELSGNHQQDLDRACDLIRLAAEAGADAIKLQTYRPDTLTLPIRNAYFAAGRGLWEGRYLWDLYAEAMTPWEWHGPLADCAHAEGLLLFSTPFDESAVDFLEAEIDPPVHKIASFELNHIPLLEKVGATGKPVILSTGMATGAEIQCALGTLRGSGCPAVVLLHCVSAYPARPEAFNLQAIPTLRQRFHVPVGLSDHSLGHGIALGATALGATVIEKHLTDRRADGGIDSGFSLEPQEFAEMARQVESIHRALGDGKLGCNEQDFESRRHRRSIFVSSNIGRGEQLTSANLRIVRPSDGLEPVRWSEVLGMVALRDLTAGDPLREGDFTPLSPEAPLPSARNGLHQAVSQTVPLV